LPFLHHKEHALCYGNNHKTCASLAAISRYITIIYTIGYLLILKAVYFFSRMRVGLPGRSSRRLLQYFINLNSAPSLVHHKCPCTQWSSICHWEHSRAHKHDVLKRCDFCQVTYTAKLWNHISRNCTSPTRPTTLSVTATRLVARRRRVVALRIAQQRGAILPALLPMRIRFTCAFHATAQASVRNVLEKSYNAFAMVFKERSMDMVFNEPQIITLFHFARLVSISQIQGLQRLVSRPKQSIQHCLSLLFSAVNAHHTQTG